MISCFVLKLSTISYDWQPKAFCLQKVKEVYKVDCVLKGNLSEKIVALPCKTSYQVMRPFILHLYSPAEIFLLP